MGNLHTHFPQAVDWLLSWTWSFPGGSAVKNLPASAGDVGLILGLGRYPGEENDYPHQCSCLENSMHRGVWWATAHGVTKNQTWLSVCTHTHTHTHTHKLNMHWELQETQQKTAAGTLKNRTEWIPAVAQCWGDWGSSPTFWLRPKKGHIMGVRSCPSKMVD